MLFLLYSDWIKHYIFIGLYIVNFKEVFENVSNKFTSIYCVTVKQTEMCSQILLFFYKYHVRKVALFKEFLQSNYRYCDILFI